MTDTSDTSRFDAVRSDTLPQVPTEAIDPADAPFAPPGGGTLDPLATGPMQLGDLADAGEPSVPSVVPEPSEPLADTTVIRGLGERDPGSEFDAPSTTRPTLRLPSK